LHELVPLSPANPPGLRPPVLYAASCTPRRSTGGQTWSEQPWRPWPAPSPRVRVNLEHSRRAAFPRTSRRNRPAGLRSRRLYQERSPVREERSIKLILRSGALSSSRVLKSERRLTSFSNLESERTGPPYDPDYCSNTRVCARGRMLKPPKGREAPEELKHYLVDARARAPSW